MTRTTTRRDAILALVGAICVPPAYGAAGGGNRASDAGATLDELRHALANNDADALAAVLTHDVELIEMAADAEPRRTEGARRVAASLLARTGADVGPGPALRLRKGFTVQPLAVAAESLPRVAGAPTQLTLYRLGPSGLVARLWLFPPVPADEPSALPRIVAYRRVWSEGRWPEVATHHAPDVRFLTISGGKIAAAGSLDERRRCYEAGFRRWRTRQAESAHPNYGCNGGPIEVVQGIGVGPYVVTVEKRWWATTRGGDYSGRAFVYVADAAGIRRVYYLLRP